MKRKISFGAAIALMLIGILITFQLTYSLVENKYKSKLSEIMDAAIKYDDLSDLDTIVEKNYIYGVKKDKISGDLLSGYVSSLGDRFSCLMSKETFETYSSLSGTASYFDLGIEFLPDKETGLLYVSGIYEASPAAKCDIKFGDVLFKIDDTVLYGKSVYEAACVIRSAQKSESDIYLIRGDKIIKHTVERTPSDKPSLSYRFIGDILYADVHDFNSTLTDVFKSAIASKADGDISGVIFDLRGVHDDDLTAACELLDYILPDGPAIRIDAADGTSSEMHASGEPFGKKIAVIVNAGTSGAGEAFAKALKAYGNAKVIGETTYGKNSLQKTFSLSDGSFLSLSFQKYALATGGDDAAVHPDVPVKLSPDLSAKYFTLSIGEDTQLEAAVSVLK